MLVSTKAKRKALDKSSQKLQVKINGKELEVVSKIKYLGFLLDNSLDWKDQIQAVSLSLEFFGRERRKAHYLSFARSQLKGRMRTFHIN